MNIKKMCIREGCIMHMKAERKFFLRRRMIILEEEGIAVELLSLIKKGLWEMNDSSKEVVETILTASNERSISSLSSVEKKRYSSKEPNIDEIELNTIQYNYIVNTYNEDTFQELLNADLHLTLFSIK